MASSATENREVWGPCLNEDEVTGKRDGCRLFDPCDDQPKKCDCCGCHRNKHQPIQTLWRPASDLLVTPARSIRRAAEVESPVRRSPRLSSGKRPVVALEGSPVKKARGLADEGDEDDLQEITSQKGLKSKVKIESGVAGPSSTPVPTKLQKFYDALVEAHPHSEYGPYNLFQNESKTWMVNCELCKGKKPGGYDTGFNLSLSNFKNQHFKSKLHLAKLAEWKEGKSIDQKKAEVLKAELQAKREGMVAAWAVNGERLSDWYLGLSVMKAII